MGKFPPSLNYNIFLTHNLNFMVTITDYKSCISRDGREFLALALQGEVTVATSQNGGFYLTAILQKI